MKRSLRRAIQRLLGRERKTGVWVDGQHIPGATLIWKGQNGETWTCTPDDDPFWHLEIQGREA